MPNARLELYKAIKKAAINSTNKKIFSEALDEIEKAISEHAAPVLTCFDDELDGKSMNIIKFAIDTGNYEINKKILESMEKHAGFLGIMVGVLGKDTKCMINIAQLLLGHCSNPKLVDLYVEHAKRTNLDFYSIIKEQIIIHLASGDINPDISEYIAFNINMPALLSSPKFDSTKISANEQDKIRKGLRQWFVMTDKSAELPKELDIGKPIRFYFDGHEDLISYLIANKFLDCDALTVCGKSFTDLITEAAKLPLVEDFKASLKGYFSAYSRNEKIIKNEDIHREDSYPEGVYIIDFEFKNIFGLHPIKVEVVVDFSQLSKKLNEVKTSVRRKSIDALKDRVAKTELTLSQVPSERIKALRNEFKTHPVAKDCFEQVYKEIKSLFAGFDLLSLKMVRANANHKETRVANIAKSTFSAVLSAAAAFGGHAVAEVTGSVVDVWIQSAEARFADKISDAALGLDLEMFAMDTASLVAKQVQNTNASEDCLGKILAHIKSQITSLKHKDCKLEFATNDQMAGYLASTAIADLQPKVVNHRHKSHSVDSGSTPLYGSHDGSGELHVALKDKKASKSNGSGGCAPGCQVS